MSRLLLKLTELVETSCFLLETFVIAEVLPWKGNRHLGPFGHNLSFIAGFRACGCRTRGEVDSEVAGVFVSRASVDAIDFAVNFAVRWMSASMRNSEGTPVLTEASQVALSVSGEQFGEYKDFMNGFRKEGNSHVSAKALSRFAKVVELKTLN